MSATRSTAASSGVTSTTNRRASVVVERPGRNAVDELRESPARSAKSGRAGLRDSPSRSATLPSTRTSCAPRRNPGRRRCSTNDRRVVVRVIRAVGVSAGCVELNRERRQAKMILKWNEVGAAPERFQFDFKAIGPSLPSLEPLARPLARAPGVVNTRRPFRDVLRHVNDQIAQ